MLPEIGKNKFVNAYNEQAQKNSAPHLPQILGDAASKESLNSVAPKIWNDDSPPEDLEFIYKACENHLDEILKKVYNLDQKFNINDKQLYTTVSRHAKQMNQIRETLGIYDIKSTRTLRDVISQLTAHIKNAYAARADAERQKKEQKKANEAKNDSRESNGSAKSTHKSQSRVTSAASEYNVNVNKKKLASISLGEFSDDLKLSKLILDRTMDAITDKFPPILKDVENVLQLFEKYLLSFQSANAAEMLNYFKEPEEEDPKKRKKKNAPVVFGNGVEKADVKTYLESVFKYENKRKELEKYTRKVIKHLKLLGEKFDSSQFNGVSFTSMSKEVQELGYRFDAASVPVVLIIPEFSAQIKRCVEVIREWIEHDRVYIDFVQIDIKTIEKNRSYLQAMKLESQQNFNQIDYKAKNLRMELDKKEAEIVNVYEKKEIELVWEEEELEDRLFSKQLQKEIIEKEMIKMKNAPENYSEYRTVFDKLVSDLRIVEVELPQILKQMNFCKTKLGYIHEKKKKIDEMRGSLEAMIGETKKIEEHKNLHESELRKLDACYGILKEIYLFKKSSETLKKIYYHLPLKSFKQASLPTGSVSPILAAKVSHNGSMRLNNSQLSLNSLQFPIDDPLTIAISIASNLLESDWIKLYFALPFHPKRGSETIQKDINEINEYFKRGDVAKEQAFSSLQKWRRLHLRAKLEDLLDTLSAIRRKDIKKAIEKHLSKSNKKKDVNSDDEVDKDPHKKEVEHLHKRLTKFFEKMKNNQVNVPVKKVQ